MPFKWMDSHMSLFLEVYQRYECLWNNKCSEYNKSNVRDKAYNSMLSDLNLPELTVADVKLKIKTVRTRYGAELAKIRKSEKSGAGVDEIYEPRLFWFRDADVFLRNVMNIKSSSSNLKDLDFTEKSLFSDKAMDGSQQHRQEEQQSANDEDNEEALPQSTESSFMTITPTIENYFPNSKNMRKRSTNNTEDCDAIKKLKEMPDNECLNEFDVFCESLAIQLKKMPLRRALICQEKLQSVMTNERLLQLAEDTSPTPHQ